MLANGPVEERCVPILDWLPNRDASQTVDEVGHDARAVGNQRLVVEERLRFRRSSGAEEEDRLPPRIHRVLDRRQRALLSRCEVKERIGATNRVVSEFDP